MARSGKTVLIVSAMTVFVIAGAVLFYAAFWRSEVANASPTAELLSELPPGAPTLVYVDLAAIRASSFYQQRPDRGPIAIPDRNYADFVRSTGFDFEKDLDRAVIASWPAGSSQGQNGQNGKHTIAVAEGRFDRKKIRDYAERKGKVEQQQGHEVFLFPTQNQPGWNAITFLGDQRVALVDGPSIAPLLARQNSDPASDPARERAARVAGAAAFAIARVPEVPSNFSPGGVQSSQITNLARSLQWITVAARPEGNDLRVSLEGECQTASDARQLQATLEVLRMVGRASLEAPKTRQSMDPAVYGVLDAVLNGADVSATAERVRILVELTPDILKLGAPKTTQ